MIKEIKYNGFSASPSDYESKDGDLAGLIGLMPEDGGLKPILNPKQLFALPQGIKVIFIHKTTAFTHYIVERKEYNKSAFKLSFFTKEDAENIKDILTFSSPINSISALGNVLCIATDENIKYAFWNAENYKVFDSSKFKFNIDLNYQNIHTNINQSSGKAIEKRMFKNDIGNAFPSSNPMTKEQTRNLFVAFDAFVNQDLAMYDKYAFKYMSLGVAAIKSYSGAYLAISNVFILAPRGGIQYSAKIGFGASGNSVWCCYEPYKEKITVDMDLEGIEDIISSIDIFLTRPFTLFDIDKEYSWTRQGNKGVTFDMKSQEKIYEEIDSMIFRKSISIDKKNFGEEIFLEQISDAREALSLADFKRKGIGAKYTFAYNNRLNLANIRNIDLHLFDIPITQKIYEIVIEGGFWNTEPDETQIWIPAYEVYPYGNMYGQHADIYKTGDNIVPFKKEENNTDTVIVIHYKKDGSERMQIHKAVIEYPLPPLFIFPNSNAYKAELYIYDSRRTKYKKKVIELYQSETMGMSLYLNTDSKRYPNFIQYVDVTIHVDPNSGASSVTIKENEEWEDTTREKFEYYKNLMIENNEFDESYIKYSEVNDPFSFPVANTVSIGTGKISGICPVVKALSQGQFGQFPLYAFTEEGVWALEVLSTGSYSAKQPVSRDVCVNSDSITQIDDAVLFATDRGIMLISGSTSQCISDSLDCESAFSVSSLPHSEELINKAELNPTDFQYLTFREFLKECKIIYDYTHQRIIVHNPSCTYAYLYSMKSKQWGMMHSDIVSGVNSYPDALAMTSENELVDFSQYDDTVEAIKGMLITRPIKLDAPDLFKTIDAVIQRGYFHKGHVSSAIYGSRDLINWFFISSSKEHYLRGFRGTPYKYFRFVILTEFNSGESLSGTTVSFDYRQNNKIR